MDNKHVSALFIAFLPAIVLAITGAVFTVRKYGVFLWFLRLEPIREKPESMFREMHSPAAPVAPRTRREWLSQCESLPTRSTTLASAGRSRRKELIDEATDEIWVVREKW